MASRAMWKGVIRFDDVAVAVKLYAAVVDKNVSFRLLHRDDGVPVKQVLVNPETGKVVEHADAKRGFEVDDDTMVLLEPDELEELEPEASRDIEVLRSSEDVIGLDALEAPKGPKLDEKQVDMATRLLEMLAGPFEPEAYENEYRERVLEMIERKKKGGAIEPPKRRRKRPTTDLTEALQASLAEGAAHA